MGEDLGAGRPEQLNRCPECGVDMQRDPGVGERLGLFYRCPVHGAYRYSWDHDRLEKAESPSPPNLE